MILMSRQHVTIKQYTSGSLAGLCRPSVLLNYNALNDVVTYSLALPGSVKQVAICNGIQSLTSTVSEYESSDGSESVIMIMRK